MDRLLHHCDVLAINGPRPAREVVRRQAGASVSAQGGRGSLRVATSRRRRRLRREVIPRVS
ncbi:MAG: hypothetical protein ACYCYA_14830 [Actinomycetes bacterium]